MTQLRNADGSGKKYAVEEVNAIAHKGTAEPLLLNERQIAHKMIVGIAKACSGKYRADHPKFVIFFEVFEKKRVEKNIDKQFLEVKIVPVEEFRDRLGRKRPVGVSQGIKSSHPAASNYPVSESAEGNEASDKPDEDAGPTMIPRQWRAIRA